MKSEKVLAETRRVVVSLNTLDLPLEARFFYVSMYMRYRFVSKIPMKASEWASTLDIELRDAKRCMKTLRKSGLIRRDGSIVAIRLNNLARFEVTSKPVVSQESKVDHFNRIYTLLRSQHLGNKHLRPITPSSKVYHFLVKAAAIADEHGISYADYIRLHIKRFKSFGRFPLPNQLISIDKIENEIRKLKYGESVDLELGDDGKYLEALDCLEDGTASPGQIDYIIFKQRLHLGELDARTQRLINGKKKSRRFCKE